MRFLAQPAGGLRGLSAPRGGAESPLSVRPSPVRSFLALGVSSLLLISCNFGTNVQLAPVYPHGNVSPGDPNQVPVPTRPSYVTSFSGGLRRPLGLASVPDGTVYVVDGDCRCVLRFDAQGSVMSSTGPNVGDRTLLYPVAAAYDAQDDVLYVSDLGTGQVLRLRGDSLLGTFPPGEKPSPFRSPIGISLTGDVIYVNDSSQGIVLRFDRSGTLLGTIGKGVGTEPGFLSYPNFSQVMPDGSLVVADSNNNRLQRFAADGEFLGIWGGPVLLPRGLALDPVGNLHVASTLGGRIEVFGPNGDHLGGYGEEGSGNGQFGLPNGMASQGRALYVADRGNSRVQVWAWPGEGQGE